MPKSRKYLDTVGMCASVLCMIHCLGTPIVVAFLASGATLGAATVTAATHSTPPTDVSPPQNHSKEGPGSQDPELKGTTSPCENATSCCDSPKSVVVHASFLGLALPLGIWTWAVGYRQHHRRESLAVGGVGLLLLTAGLLGVPWPGEQPLTVLGSLCVAAAHWWNHKGMSCCQESHTPT